jgi:hypothetical protein
LEYLLFVVYLILFAWLVTKVKFFTDSGLSNSQLIIIFLLKVIAGIFYGWIGLYYGNLAQMLDTWAYHHVGLTEYRILMNNPHEYFTNIFQNPYPGGMGRFFGSSDSYWNDLKGNIFVKLLSIFDILSFGRYYVNVIFYSFISLFGPIALFRVMKDLFPGRKVPVLLATFSIPSFIYWTSGVHKEGLIFVGISLIIYHLYFAWKEKRYTPKRIVGFTSGLLILLVLRNFLLMLIVPAIIAWLLTTYRPKYGLLIFTTVYLLFGVLFFTAKYVSPRFDFPQAVVDKQQAFLRMQGGASTIPIKELQPTAASFVKNTPQAITLAFLRPYPGDVVHLLSLAASAEIMLVLLLFVLSFLFRKKTETARNAVYLCIFLSFSILLAIGFSVNNLGAIVRYRSIILPLLVIPMVAQTDWTRVLAIFNGKKKLINQ